MSMFKSKEPKDSAKRQDGKDFLALAKDDYYELFSSFVANADDYDSVDEYTDALETQTWELTEGLIKKSYFNGRKSANRRSNRN